MKRSRSGSAAPDPHCRQIINAQPAQLLKIDHPGLLQRTHCLHTDPTSGWDDPITREEDTLLNDASYRGDPLPVSGRIGRDRFPSIGRLSREGLRGIIEPDPPS